MEPQGPSGPFEPLNRQITQMLAPGQKEHDTLYGATWYQNSGPGTDDIINTVKAAEPGHCFILEGYSQGATATVNALPRLNDDYDKILGVILFGNPCRQQGTPMLPGNAMPGWAPPVLNDSPGILVGTLLCPTLDGDVPEQWRGKVKDICQPGDPMCSRNYAVTQGLMAPAHGMYGVNTVAQDDAYNFAMAKMQMAMPMKFRSFKKQEEVEEKKPSKVMAQNGHNKKARTKAHETLKKVLIEGHKAKTAKAHP